MNRYIVYYRINMHFWGELPKRVSSNSFFVDYKPVEILSAKRGLEEVWNRMQGENWSPNGEKREYIKMLGLSHTSISVGDVIYSEDEDKFYSVASFGFEELEVASGM